MKTKKNPRKNLEDKKVLFFQTGLIVALICVFYAFQWKLQQRPIIQLDKGIIIHQEEDMIPITRPPEPPKPVPPPLTQIIITNEDIIDLPNPVVNVDDFTNYTASVFVVPVLPPEPPVEDVFHTPEHMPEFPGGIDALYRYLNRNLKYPRTESRLGIFGTVYINFIVEKDGSITQASVMRGVSAGLDEEALRVIMNMPRWAPGKMGNQAVRVSYTIPISFRLNN